MANVPFQFKQFSITQDRCAAKIGTDGVLLGAWASLELQPHSILDIGTGTGIIAIMLAQRSVAEIIDALELDDDAYEQATENFENSNWGDRLFCYHAHLYEYATEIEETYDLIVSNPPFYESSLAYSNKEQPISGARKQARFENAMPFELLVGAVAKLLSKSGSFQVIIPHHREKDFIILASNAHLIPTRITHVQGNPESPVKRSLLEFQRIEYLLEKIGEDEFIRFRESVLPQKLIIEHTRHEYTKEYTALVKDFYLKM